MRVCMCIYIYIYIHLSLSLPGLPTWGVPLSRLHARDLTGIDAKRPYIVRNSPILQRAFSIASMIFDYLLNSMVILLVSALEHATDCYR